MLFTYDTHVDRMMDSKKSTLSKSPLTCFDLSFIPLLLMLASKALTGFRKKQQKVSFLKQNKREGEKITWCTADPRVLSDLLGKVKPKLQGLWP